MRNEPVQIFYGDIDTATPVSTNNDEKQTSNEPVQVYYNDPIEDQTALIRQTLSENNADPLLLNKDVNIPSYIDKISEDYEESISDTVTAYEEYNKGNITKAEAALRLVGNTFNFTADIIGESVLGGISLITPDFIEEPVKNLFKNGVEKVISTPVGQRGIEKLLEGVDAYAEFKKENPRTAENIEAVFDISLLLAPPKVNKAIGDETSFRKLAETVEQLKSKKAIYKENKQYFDIFDEGGKETIEKTSSKGVEFDKRQERAINALKDTKKVKPSKSSYKNTVAINDELIELQEKKIKSILEPSNTAVDGSAFRLDYDQSFDKLYKDRPDKEVTGNAITKVDEIVEESLTKHANKDGTISLKGMWEARKELDNWLNEQKGDNAFNKTGAVVEAVYAARDAMNKGITDVNPEIGKIMEKESGLLFARAGAATKAQKEAGAGITRLMKNIGSTIGLNKDIAFAITGLTGGLAAYGTLAMPITVGAMLAGGSYLLGKGIWKYGLSPESIRNNLSTTLKAIDKSIVAAQKARNTELARQLRTDRSALVTLVKNAQERWENGGKEEYYKDNKETQTTENKPQKRPN